MPGSTTTSLLTPKMHTGASVLSDYSTSISKSSYPAPTAPFKNLAQKTTGASSTINSSSYSSSGYLRNMRSGIQQVSAFEPSGSKIATIYASQLRKGDLHHKPIIAGPDQFNGPNRPPFPYIPGDDLKRPPHIPSNLPPSRPNYSQENTIKPFCPHNDTGPITSTDIVEHIGNAEFGSALRDTAAHPTVQKVVESTVEIAQNVLKTIGEEINKVD